MSGCKQIELGEATLSLRPYEYLKITDDKPRDPKGRLFGVAVVNTPPFPGEREETWRFETPFAICACTEYPQLKGWGFIHLEENTKRVIGDLMTGDYKCEPGRWYWLQISDEPIS